MSSFVTRPAMEKIPPNLENGQSDSRSENGIQLSVVDNLFLNLIQSIPTMRSTRQAVPRKNQLCHCLDSQIVFAGGSMDRNIWSPLYMHTYS